jgi:hypothetical protein
VFFCTDSRPTEIYNFRSLRDELTEPDEPWQSHSDTEVILRAWRRWGLDCLTRLRGMYAFALWDAASRKLFLARDPFGIKPLYWARRGRTVGFASEIRAILAMGIVDGRVDPARVAEFLRWQSAVGQGAIVEGVEMVEAGGVVVVGENGELRIADCGLRNGDGGLRIADCEMESGAGVGGRWTVDGGRWTVGGGRVGKRSRARARARARARERRGGRGPRGEGPLCRGTRRFGG